MLSGKGDCCDSGTPLWANPAICTDLINQKRPDIRLKTWLPIVTHAAHMADACVRPSNEAGCLGMYTDMYVGLAAHHDRGTSASGQQHGEHTLALHVSLRTCIRAATHASACARKCSCKRLRSRCCSIDCLGTCLETHV